MRKIALLILFLPLASLQSWAWHDSQAARQAVTALFRNLEAVQSQFSALGAQHPRHPDLYMPIDLDADGVWEIWVRSHDGKVGILYGQAPDGTLCVIASDTESEEATVSGNLISIATGKHAGVSEAKLMVWNKGVATVAPFVESRSYSGVDGSTKSTYLSASGKAASRTEVKRFFSLATEGTTCSETDFFTLGMCEPVNLCGDYALLDTDNTVSQLPLFATAADFKSGTFTAIPYSQPATAKAYTKMVLKPHIADARFASTDTNGYSRFQLSSPQAAKNMFRGYQPHEAAPLVVQSSWLASHSPLQFSRWKAGETKKWRREQWMLDAIAKRYGRAPKSVHWIADVPGAERHFYIAEFDHSGDAGKAPVYTLAAVVCFAEGELVSAFDFWGCGDQSAPHSTSLINDACQFRWPEFMVMAGTDAGLEIYLRHADSEKSAYYCIREVGNQWVKVLSTTMWSGAH